MRTAVAFSCFLALLSCKPSPTSPLSGRAVAPTKPDTGDAPPRREIDNVAAFARLCGVVRYFYPSDASANRDWNRFTVEGVSRARTAADAKDLETILRSLFGPLGRGIEIGATLGAAPAAGSADAGLVAWRYLGPGLTAEPGVYARKRTHRAETSGIDGFVTLAQTLAASPLRGRTIRLRGRVRATASDRSGAAALWLRVDRANDAIGFFDNMGDRPIRTPDWRGYEIEGLVADDGTSVAFGVMASGGVTADFDAIELAVRDGTGAWTPLPIDDPGFEVAARATSRGWKRAGSSKRALVTRPMDGAPHGRQFLRFSPPAAPASQPELFEEGVPTTGAHVDLDLGLGLKARVPLALSDTDARAVPTEGTGPTPLRTAPLDQRLADTVVAWNVFRHFYPYWSEAGVDWEERLRPQLEAAYGAETREMERDALRSLVADARDGHGLIGDPLRAHSLGRLPVRFGLVGDRVVVTATRAAGDVPVGAEVSAIDGVPAAARLAKLLPLESGTRQWKETRAMDELATCPAGVPIHLVVDAGSGPGVRTVPCEVGEPPLEKRPPPVTEVKTGVWYVDLTRARLADVTPVMARLASAAGVVFDLRGYPADGIGTPILTHLIDAPEKDRWMHVAKIVGPNGQSAGWKDYGWDLEPVRPRFAGKIVFMTDGRAISQAESIMGYVADHKLGTIVGSPTAGTNGNVVRFEVPGGFSIMFTGMRVTRHDGQTPYHLAGTLPDVPIAPTIEGIRAGRDEVLDRAITLIQGK